MSVARHTLYNGLGAAVPLLVLLATVPLYVSIVGLPRYGILAIAWLLLGYMNLLDLGLGRALSQRLATLAYASAEERSRVFWAALTLSGVLILLALILFFPLAQLVMARMEFDTPQLQLEISVALPWLAAILPFGMAHGVLNGALEGRRRFFQINVISTLSAVAGAIFPLAAAMMFGPELWHLIAATLLARCIGIVLLLRACRTAVPLQAFARPCRSDMERLVQFGGWAAVTNLVSPLMQFWDRFAIGALISSTAVGLYVIPFNLVSQLAVLPNALASALFPRIAETPAAHARAITAESVTIIAFIVTPVSLGMLLLGGPFLAIWLGESIALAAAPTMFLLIGGAWANSLARIAFADLQARGRPDLPALSHLGQIIPYVILLYFALSRFGIEGAAAVWSIRCIADAVILLRFSGVGFRTVRPLIYDFVIMLIAVMFALVLPLWSILKLFAIISIIALWCVMAWPRRPRRLTGMGSDLLERVYWLKDRRSGPR